MEAYKWPSHTGRHFTILCCLNPEGHQNRISGLKVTAILLKGWILPIGVASAVEGVQSKGLPRLVYLQCDIDKYKAMSIFET